MSELEGQMALFTTDGIEGEAVQYDTETCAGCPGCPTVGQPEELCDECGTACTSSTECVEASGLHDPA